MTPTQDTAATELLPPCYGEDDCSTAMMRNCTFVDTCGRNLPKDQAIAAAVIYWRKKADAYSDALANMNRRAEMDATKRATIQRAEPIAAHGCAQNHATDNATKNATISPSANGMTEQLLELVEFAVEEIESWGAYASEYFQEKHDLKGTVQSIRDQARAIARHLSDKEQK